MRRAYRQMTLVGLLWGTIGPAAAYLDEHTTMSSLQVSLWRLLIALVPCGAIAAVFVRRAGVRLRADAVALGLVVGVFNAGFQLAYFAAVASAGIAVPTLVALGLGPIVVALGETVVFRARPDRRTLLSLVVALLGLALLVLDGPAEATVAGVVLAVGSAVAYATATLIAGPASRRLDTASLNAVAILGGVLTLAPVAVLAGGGPGAPDSAGGVFALLHLGLVVSGVAYAMYFAAARRLPATHIVLLALLEPVAATVIAAVFFDEALTAGAVLGGLLLLGAVVSLRAMEEPPPVAA